MLEILGNMVEPPIENYAKMNRNRFPITILLTTMLCKLQTTANLFFLAYQMTL